MPSATASRCARPPSTDETSRRRSPRVTSSSRPLRRGCCTRTRRRPGDFRFHVSTEPAAARFVGGHASLADGAARHLRGLDGRPRRRPASLYSGPSTRGASRAAARASSSRSPRTNLALGDARRRELGADGRRRDRRLPPSDLPGATHPRRRDARQGRPHARRDARRRGARRPRPRWRPGHRGDDARRLGDDPRAAPRRAALPLARARVALARASRRTSSRSRACASGRFPARRCGATSSKGLPQGLPEAGDEGPREDPHVGAHLLGRVSVLPRGRRAHPRADGQRPVVRRRRPGGSSPRAPMSSPAGRSRACLDVGDAATGTRVLHDLYHDLALAPGHGRSAGLVAPPGRRRREATA